MRADPRELAHLARLAKCVNLRAIAAEVYGLWESSPEGSHAKAAYESALELIGMRQDRAQEITDAEMADWRKLLDEWAQEVA